MSENALDAAIKITFKQLFPMNYTIIFSVIYNDCTNLIVDDIAALKI